MKHPHPGRLSNLVGSAFCGLFVPLLLLPFGLRILSWLGLGSAEFTISLLNGVGLIFGALVFGLVALFSYGQSTEYLLTGPQGIEKHGFGYGYRTPWENVAGVGLLGRDVLSANPQAEQRTRQTLALMKEEAGRQQGARRAFYNLLPNLVERGGTGGGLGLDGIPEGLVLHRPVPVERRPWARHIVTQVHFIDLSDYPHWRHTPLGREIARYAPQAMGKP